jgi:predicted nucleotidyltransferase component of viral defense system
MISPIYRAQVRLLLKVLPYVAREEAFALKGGTAINLFERDLPRLSVDIDLTYLPFEDRKTALNGIAAGLGRIRDDVSQSIPGIQVALLPQRDGQDTKLSCRLDGVQIKVEVNTTIRGFLQEPRLMQVAESVQNEFELFAAIKVVSHGELYGGKICAALDRQHPRDLFDIHDLFEHGGITEEIRLGFIAALLSHSRPIHEMLQPNFQDQRTAFEAQFAGMTEDAFSYSDFESTRERLVVEINNLLTDDDRKFLLSFKAGEPQWGLYPIEGLQEMSAVQWKLLNIKRLLSKDHTKHGEQLELLCKCLGVM